MREDIKCQTLSKSPSAWDETLSLSSSSSSSSSSLSLSLSPLSSLSSLLSLLFLLSLFLSLSFSLSLFFLSSSLSLGLSLLPVSMSEEGLVVNQTMTQGDAGFDVGLLSSLLKSTNRCCVSMSTSPGLVEKLERRRELQEAHP